MLRTGAVSNAMVKIVSCKTVHAGIGTACRYCCSNNFVLFVYTASQKYEFQMLYLFVLLVNYFPFLCLIPGQSMWDVGQMEWHWGRFFSDYLGFTLSVITPMFPVCQWLKCFQPVLPPQSVPLNLLTVFISFFLYTCETSYSGMLHLFLPHPLFKLKLQFCSWCLSSICLVSSLYCFFSSSLYTFLTSPSSKISLIVLSLLQRLEVLRAVFLNILVFCSVMLCHC